MEMNPVKDIIPLIYEAGYDAAHWPDVTEKMSTLFGDAAVAVMSDTAQSTGASLANTTLLDNSLMTLHIEEYSTPDQNPCINRLLKDPLHRSFNLYSFIDSKNFEREPSARAILHPQKFDKGLFVTLERNEFAFGYSSILRRRNQPDFEERHVQALNVLSRHISRACKIRQNIFQNSQYKSIADWNNQVGHPLEGTILLTRRGIVMDADPRAQAIMECQNELVLHYGKLTSRSRRTNEDNESLQHYLSRPHPDLHPFTLWTKNGALLTLELVPKSFGGENIACQAVNIRMTRPQAEPNIAAFASAYCLTKAETKVASALTTAANATQAAKSLGLSRYTMKDHLEHIYKKTNCPSLPQLMMLIGRFG